MHAAMADVLWLMCVSAQINTHIHMNTIYEYYFENFYYIPSYCTHSFFNMDLLLEWCGCVCPGGHAAPTAAAAGGGQPGGPGDAGAALLLEPQEALGRTTADSSLAV